MAARLTKSPEVTDNHVQERLLRVPDLTLNKALEIARAAEATQTQLKQMQNLHEVNAVRKKREVERNPKRKHEETKPVTGDVQEIECTLCGRKHAGDKLKCPAYGNQCKNCGKKNHFAVKCKTVNRPSKRTRADQHLHFVDHLEQSSLDEYTIDVVTHQVSAVKAKTCSKQLFSKFNVNNA